MCYIILDEENRIVDCSNIKISEKSIAVKDLPGGNIFDYKYIEGKYVHMPLPVPEPAPTLQNQIDDINLALADIYGGAI